MAKRKKDYSIGSVFLAVALLLAALAFAEVASYLAGPARAESIVGQAAALSKPDPSAAQTYVEQAKKTVEVLKKQNLFVKEPPREHPVKQVDGILGDEVLIGDKKYKVRDMIDDAKVIAIEPTQVMIEWDGQTKGFAPLAAASSGRTEPPRKPEPAPTGDKAPVLVRPAEGPQVAQEVQAAPEDGDPFAWMGIEIPERLRAMLLEKWNSLTDEQKEEAKREWNNMSDEQKQQAVQAFERM